MSKFQEILQLGCRYLPKMPSHKLKVLGDIEKCRTAKAGHQVRKCERCHYKHYSHLSCGSRYCTKCGSDKTRKWINQRMDDLLPVRYHMVTFTIPSRLHPVFLANEKLFVKVFFQAAAEALKDACRYQYAGLVHIGLLMALQTWKQNQGLHPHLHTMIPAGGFSEDYSEWIPFDKKYLVDQKSLRRLYQCKLIDKLVGLFRKDKLMLPKEISPFDNHFAFKRWLYGKNDELWNVRIDLGEGSPETAFHYIGRYVYKTAISEDKIVRYDESEVVLKIKNRNTKKSETATLTLAQFLRRFLLHILDPGITRLRYFGFLSCSLKAKAIRAAYDIFNRTTPPISESRILKLISEIMADIERQAGWPCPNCHVGRMKFDHVIRHFHSFRLQPEVQAMPEGG